jgi:hypothetical protein
MNALPARPSLESLRKQAKKLARDTAAGDAGAVARARAQLPSVALPLTQRNAQLVIAREYGYAGWPDLTAEVHKRLGGGLEWAVAQARRIVHDNDVAGLTHLIAEYPALLSWKSENDEGGVLAFATGAYGDAFDPARERNFTREACAELLIDAGAVVTRSVLDGLIASRARGLLDLFRRKGLLPTTLEFFAALGDLEAARTSLDQNARDVAVVNEAFLVACAFGHDAVALLLLDRCIALDPGGELGRRIDEIGSRSAFVESIAGNRSKYFSLTTGPWELFVRQQASRAAHDGDVALFTRWIEREPSLLDDANVEFQVRLVEQATLANGAAVIVALLDMNPALLRRRPPPRSQVFEFAFTYGKTNLVPLLARVWPVPTDLEAAAALGDLALVKQRLGESDVVAQRVLDTALAYAVLNDHFDAADVLLEHGADVDTNWGSHEPASILHELVAQVGTRENPAGAYDAMRFLIDRGIDMTIKDYRWDATPRGWALHGMNDPKLAEWLEEMEREQSLRREPVRPT